MDDYFKIVAAGPAFFVSAWLLMIFAGIAGADVGIRPFGYLTAMVVTIGLWLTLAPAIGAIARPARAARKADRSVCRPGGWRRARGRPGVSQARAPARRGNGPPRPFGPIIPGHPLRSAPEPEPVPPVPPGLLRRPGRGAES